MKLLDSAKKKFRKIMDTYGRKITGGDPNKAERMRGVDQPLQEDHYPSNVKRPAKRVPVPIRSVVPRKKRAAKVLQG